MAFLDDLFQQLWLDYTAITPQAARIHELLSGRGETLVNDHIALRTFDHPQVSIEMVERAFVDAGYEAAATYDFPAKKLVAYHYEHSDPERPKVFISALLLDECSSALQEGVNRLLEQVPKGAVASPGFVTSGRPWQLDLRTYRALAAESEYAAWVAAFGFRANHFTVDVSRLSTFSTLEELTTFLAAQGFRLNQSGGVIKGTPADLLEQASTMADEVEVAFSDEIERIPSCYYEFARRYPMADGRLFQGFVSQSADKLFESTNAVND